MITPQPQPAAYWIALLDELTDGWFGELNLKTTNKKCYRLSDFLFVNTSFTEIGGYELLFWHKIQNNAEYIESGKSVIDAAVELEDPKNDHVRVEERLALYGRLEKQVQLYKRCNGIKD